MGQGEKEARGRIAIGGGSETRRANESHKETGKESPSQRSLFHSFH